MWTIDTDISDHDAVKVGNISQLTSRVHLSSDDFPDPLDAEVCASLISMTIHGGMATSIRHCL